MTQESERNNHVNVLRAELEIWSDRARRAESQLYAITNTLSWKITKPLRILNVIEWKMRGIAKPGTETVAAAPTSNYLEDARQHTRFEKKFYIDTSRPIAVLAHWSNSNHATESVSKLICELQVNNFQVIVVSTSPSTEDLTFNSVNTDELVVIRKNNSGYDFGSWAVAIDQIPEIHHSQEVLLLNDSVLGPFTSIQTIIENLRNSPYDVTGLTDSLEIRYHIQSYWMHFKNASLSTIELMEFWKSITVQKSHRSVTEEYEIGLTRTAQLSGLKVGALFPWNLVGNYWENSTIDNWAQLINLGFPFVKRKLRVFRPNISTREIARVISNKFEISDAFASEINQM